MLNTLDCLCSLTIAEAAETLKRGDLSPIELTQAVLDRIEATEPRVRAYATVARAEALRAAGEAERAIRRGEYRGPLHGIPIALKDLYCTAGIPTEAGSTILRGFVPSYDAAVTERLKAAGAILIGKTTTHEFAYGYNPLPTRNPWDVARSPGGSSAGSGAAVAAGTALAAMGTDDAGSIRIPACLNGVVGLKPTFGRVSKYGVIPSSWSLDHCGPLARTVEDCALVLNAVAGYDPRDRTTIDLPVPDYTLGLRGGVRGLRLGVPSNYFFHGIHPAVREAVEQAIGVLESLGAVRVEVTIPHVALSTPVGVIIAWAEAASIHQRWLRRSPDQYHPGTRTMLEAAEMLLATHYLRALRGRTIVKHIFRDVFRAHRLDALVTPTQPTAATLVEQKMVTFDDIGQEPILLTLMRLTFPFSIAGLPALSVPCGFTEVGDGHVGAGLPIGLHIAGRPFDESLVLRIGHAYQTATDWHTRRPPV